MHLNYWIDSGGTHESKARRMRSRPKLSKLFIGKAESLAYPTQKHKALACLNLTQDKKVPEQWWYTMRVFTHVLYIYIYRSKINESGHQKMVPLCYAAGFMRLCKWTATVSTAEVLWEAEGHCRWQKIGGQALMDQVPALSSWGKW